MTNINYLIDKYGTDIKRNGTDTVAFLDVVKETKLKGIYKKFKDRVAILIKEDIDLKDEFEILSKTYYVFQIRDKSIVKNDLIYCDVELYADIFKSDIKVHKQSLSMQGCNLPSQTEDDELELKAYIETVKPIDYLQFSLQGHKIPTHLFTLKYTNSVSVGDLIHFGDKRFEILYTENIDELDMFIELSCIEVLNV